MSDAPRILAGRYEIGDLIGRGGMAEVHIGHDTRLGRTVAIKMLRPDLARDPTFQARFRREAQAAASLNHPAIVAVYDTGEEIKQGRDGEEERFPFIVMEYVEGHTVRDILQGGQPVPIDEAAEIAIGVLSALEYSHHAGIVHRDIKPANVMITPTGAVKVMDFGIARAIADTSAGMTQTQAVIGTAQYLSPEQARGETVDTRSDLYSSGCLLFELLTGRPPFLGESPVSVAYQHVREPAPLASSIASDIPAALDSICNKALAKERDARYQSAEYFRGDLEAFLSGQPVSAAALAGVGATQAMAAPAAATEMMPTSAQPWANAVAGEPPEEEEEEDEEEEQKRSWIMWTLIGVAVAAILGLLAYFVFFNNAEEELVPVPNVVGMERTIAVKAIEDAKLKADVREEALPEPAGTVSKTEPGADEKVASGSTVIVVVSTGPAAGQVPNLRGKTIEEATIALTEAGLTLGDQEIVDNAEVLEGQIVESTPAGGEKVPAGSPVSVKVSSGKLVIKSYIGQSVDEAQAELEALGLTVTTIQQEDSSSTPNTVIDQSPGAGKVTPGTTIKLTYAISASPKKVPNVVDVAKDDAIRSIRDSGFQVEEYSEQSSTIAAGRVIRTDPGGGTDIIPGTMVRVYVSSGPGPGTTPTNTHPGGGGGTGSPTKDR